MSDRVNFEIVCPHDHKQTVTFTKGEFEAELKSGALVFHCIHAIRTGPLPMKTSSKLKKGSGRPPGSAGGSPSADPSFARMRGSPMLHCVSGQVYS